MASVNAYLHFDGVQTYIELPSNAKFSLAVSGELTISVWIRPATLSFAHTEGSGYVHWLGKGEKEHYEWTFRMYSEGNTEDRGNRISFYVFNPDGGLGVGSYFQDALQAGEWIHVVGAADRERTYIYRDGKKRDSDVYAGKINPQAGGAPLRVGTRELKSFFAGEIRAVRIWSRVLTDAEIAALHNADLAPSEDLVAEYLLNGDVAYDSAGKNNGVIVSPTWISH
jgi:hypothetical protein